LAIRGRVTIDITGKLIIELVKEEAKFIPFT